MKPNISQKLRDLKQRAGTHSPSIQTIRAAIPELRIDIDACFLSNPYATDLIISQMKSVFHNEKNLRDAVEYYPSQNTVIAQSLSKYLGVPSGKILVGNGAVELIEYAMKNLVGNAVALPLPTFSSYYESLGKNKKIHFYKTNASENYQLDLGGFSDFIEDHACDSAVLINPANPTGQYINKNEIEIFLEKNRHLKLVILDESFIHFSYEDAQKLPLMSYYDLLDRFPALVIIKSMSKDFGVAGLRAGYMVGHEDLITSTLSQGFLWNSNGFAEMFFSVIEDRDFVSTYEVARKRFIREMISFGQQLTQFGGLTVLPSKANFYLISSNLVPSIQIFDALLVRYGIYVRECGDKLGLNGNFLRIASRSAEENSRIVTALGEILEG
jgi:histidinol-phosphate/aromatic aminotransferase/cobyric acid decarboxylase-like protein